MSEEHKALGYRPPPGSLAADAQAAAAKRPHVKEHTVEPHVLTVAALKDAARIAYVTSSQELPLVIRILTLRLRSERGATGAKKFHTLSSHSSSDDVMGVF